MSQQLKLYNFTVVLCKMFSHTLSCLSLQVENFRQSLYQEVCCVVLCSIIRWVAHFSFAASSSDHVFMFFQAENLFSNFIPQKVIQLDALLRVSKSCILLYYTVTLWKDLHIIFFLFLTLSCRLCFQDDALSITDLSSLKALLDIPIPDPPSPEDEVRPAPSIGFSS